MFAPLHGDCQTWEDGRMANLPDAMDDPACSLDDIVGLEEGRDGLRRILDAHFRALHGYSNIGIVWEAAQDSLPLFLNDNAINTAGELGRFLRRAFPGECVMSGPHIWRPGPDCPTAPQGYVGVIANLARQSGGTVTREQIDEYFGRIRQRTPDNATILRQGSFALYAPGCFILTESLDLTGQRAAAMAKQLDRLFERENVPYVVLRDISGEWFSSLPPLEGGLGWTPLLLQEVIRLRPDIGYRTVFSGLRQALDTLGAAIVPNGSEIGSFADVAHRCCHEIGLLGKRMAAEELRLALRDAGMLKGNELIWNLHEALRDHRFAFTDENRTVKILER